MRFRGISKLSVDAKGRLAVPKSHRDRLAEHGVTQLVATVDPAGCLLIYPGPVWEEVEQKLNDLPNSSQAVRRMQRLYLGYASDVEFDSAGRVLLPAELREFAGIDRKAVLIGQGKKFELWDEAAWQEESVRWKEELNSMESSELPEDLQSISF